MNGDNEIQIQNEKLEIIFLYKYFKFKNLNENLDKGN